MGCAEKCVERAEVHSCVSKLAFMTCKVGLFNFSTDCVHVLVHGGLHNLDIVRNVVNLFDELRKKLVRFVVIFHIKSEDLVFNRVWRGLCIDVTESFFQKRRVVVEVVVFFKSSESFLVETHVCRVHEVVVAVVLIIKVLCRFADNNRLVDIEEPVCTGNFVECAESIKYASVRAFPFEEGGAGGVFISTAVEDSSIDSEALVKLWHLAMLTIRGCGIAGFHAAAEAFGHLVTQKEVADKSFGRDCIGFRKGVPIYHDHLF